jgi:hypothetical protein
MNVIFQSRETLFLRYAHTYTARAVYVALNCRCVSIGTLKTPKTSNFGPTDIACLPGPKIIEILEISRIYKKNKYLFFIL